jgi:hypothetical protein
MSKKCITVVEEVETLENLAPLMQELAATLPEGSLMIWQRVRDRKTIH